MVREDFSADLGKGAFSAQCSHRTVVLKLGGNVTNGCRSKF